MLKSCKIERDYILFLMMNVQDQTSVPRNQKDETTSSQKKNRTKQHKKPWATRKTKTEKSEDKAQKTQLAKC